MGLERVWANRWLRRTKLFQTKQVMHIFGPHCTVGVCICESVCLCVVAGLTSVSVAGGAALPYTHTYANFLLPLILRKFALVLLKSFLYICIFRLKTSLPFRIKIYVYPAGNTNRNYAYSYIGFEVRYLFSRPISHFSD